MKSSSIRRPALGNTSEVKKNKTDMSVGDILRRAKKELIIRRCINVFIILIIIAAVIFAIMGGVAEDLIDKFYSLLE